MVTCVVTRIHGASLCPCYSHKSHCLDSMVVGPLLARSKSHRICLFTSHQRTTCPHFFTLRLAANLTCVHIFRHSSWMKPEWHWVLGPISQQFNKCPEQAPKSPNNKWIQMVHLLYQNHPKAAAEGRSLVTFELQLFHFIHQLKRPAPPGHFARSQSGGGNQQSNNKNYESQFGFSISPKSQKHP